MIIFLVGGPWKSNVVLEKYLKSGRNFFYEPWLNMASTFYLIIIFQEP